MPKDLFPETESSKNTGEMNIQLRHMLHTAVAHMYAADGDASKVEAIIADATAAGHRILTIHLGGRRFPSTGNGPTRMANSTATARLRRLSSGRSTWVRLILRTTCA